METQKILSAIMLSTMLASSLQLSAVKVKKESEKARKQRILSKMPKVGARQCPGFATIPGTSTTEVKQVRTSLRPAPQSQKPSLASAPVMTTKKAKIFRPAPQPPKGVASQKTLKTAQKPKTLEKKETSKKTKKRITLADRIKNLSKNSKKLSLGIGAAVTGLGIFALYKTIKNIPAILKLTGALGIASVGEYFGLRSLFPRKEKDGINKTWIEQIKEDFAWASSNFTRAKSWIGNLFSSKAKAPVAKQ